jgi:hypothetical protein
MITMTAKPATAFSDPIALPRGPLGLTEGGPGSTRQVDAASDGRVLAVVAADQTDAVFSGSGGSAPPQMYVVLT